MRYTNRAWRRIEVVITRTTQNRLTGDEPFRGFESHRLRVAGVPRGGELRQVPVARGGDRAVPAEQVELHALGALEVVVHPVVVTALVEARLKVPVGEFGVQRHQVDAPVAGGGQPREVVDAGDGGVQFLPRDAGDAVLLFEHRAQQLLRAEHLVAAAEGLDAGEHVVQRAHAQRHGVGVVDDPGARRVRLDGLGDLDVHRDRAHGAHEAARAHRVAHRLPHAHALGQVDVAAHLLERAGEDGDHDEVRAGQGVLQRVGDLVFPAGDGVRVGADFIADDLVALGGGAVDVVQLHRAAHVRVHREVHHKAPRPAAGAAADVGDVQRPCPRTRRGMAGGSNVHGPSASL